MKKSLFVLATLLASGALLCGSAFGWGSVTGRVFDDATDEPLAGHYVHAYNEPGGKVVGWARTDSFGNYTLYELEQGIYYVWVYGGNNCASEWWQDTPYPEEADPIEVHDGETVDHIDFGLACKGDYGCIVGRITDENTGDPIRGAVVHVYTDPQSWPVAYTSTGENGYYEICRLEQGIYFVHARAQNCEGEWFDNKLHPEHADSVEVRAGQITDGINFALQCQPGHGCIAGRVVDQRTGLPINDALVRVYTNPLGDPVTQAYTNGYGFYKICELEEGIYFVHAHAQNCEGEWFDNKLHPEHADSVEVRAGQITDGINFALECRGGYGCIVGRVTDERTGRPINDALVRVYTDPFGDPIARALTNEQGFYEICELEEGTYFVSAGAEHCKEEWFDNKWCPGRADPVEVRAGQVTDHIDFSLACACPKGCIVGRVTDERTGDPIPNAFVAAFKDPRGERVAYAFTDEDGFYEICKLVPGVYYAFAHAKNCEGEWYNNKRRPAEADPIEVHPGKVTDGIDFTLPCERPRRGCIAGRVTNERTGRPIPRAFVAVFRRLEGQPVAHTFTDENGFYLVCRLEPGTYYAFAHAKDCDGEWYRNKRRREEADPIGVRPGSITRRINFTLECEGENLCISGRVVDDSTGEAINDAFIVAMMIGRPYARYAFSGRDGRYEICGLIPGKYVVFAHAGGYIGEFYDNVYRWEHATPVMPPEDDIDFSLGRRRRLNRLVSGKVFCGTGPATRAMVYAYDSGMAAFGQVPVSSALTEADGSYTLEGLSAGTYMITATRPGDPTTSYPDLVTVGPNAVEGIDIHLGATMVRGGAVSRADAREVLLKTMPNPFRNKTRFSFTIPNTSDVRLDIFDLSGRLVATLVDENLPEGEHTAEWSAQGVPSGVYVSKLSCSGVSVVRKIVLAR